MWYKDLIEIAFGTSLFINSFLYIPQIFKLLKIKHSRELSILTFAGFLLIQISVALHGLVRKDYLLSIGTAASIVTCSIVVSLIVYYRMKNAKNTPESVTVDLVEREVAAS